MAYIFEAARAQQWQSERGSEHIGKKDPEQNDEGRYCICDADHLIQACVPFVSQEKRPLAATWG